MGSILHPSRGFILSFSENGFPQVAYGAQTVQDHDTNSTSTEKNSGVPGDMIQPPCSASQLTSVIPSPHSSEFQVSTEKFKCKQDSLISCLVKKKKSKKLCGGKKKKKKHCVQNGSSLGQMSCFPVVSGEVVNELIESKAIIFEMPKRVGVESETEEKLMCYFYKWKEGIGANFLLENYGYHQK